MLYEIKLYLSFSQTINEEKDAEGGQHRDLPRFVNIYFFSFLFLKCYNKLQYKNFNQSHTGARYHNTIINNELMKKIKLIFSFFFQRMGRI